MTLSIAFHTIAFIDFSWTIAFKDWVLGLVRNYPYWTAVIAFVLAFGESLAFVSLIFPAWVILFVGIGPLLAQESWVQFWTVASAAAVGAALGDWLSYWLGYHYHDRIQQMWPLKDRPDLM